MNLRIVSVALAALVLVSARAEAAGGPVFSKEQAERGREAYVHSCVMCHGEGLDDGDFGGAPLRGSWFRGHWGSGDVAALFSYLKTAMPPDNPASLSDKSYSDITAYILLRNNYPAGDSDMPPDEDALAKMSLQR
ncbi:MAG: hypothetical protein JWL62_3109 [Hyphomicrobiales bacterium]|nr:hypothetical protein [Hyphomicrobiales bacterium]